MTREASGGDTKAVKEDAYEVETEVDGVVSKVIKRSKSYHLPFRWGLLYQTKRLSSNRIQSV